MRFSPVSFYNWLFGSHDDSSFTSSTKEGSAISSVKPWAPSDQKKYDQITKFQLLLIRFFPLAFFFSGCGVRIGVKVGDDTGEDGIKDSESPPECIPATEIPYDGIDQDCDGLDLTDVDGDGYDAIVVGGEDCDDENDAIHPGAEEDYTNDVDDDCNGRIDDEDGDGYSINDGDCDDEDPEINPGASEICNGIDDDCDGNIDEGLETTIYYEDADGDGYGNSTVSQEACGVPDGYVSQPDDCDDGSFSINPGESESCYDEADNNCNGEADEGCCDAIGTSLDLSDSDVAIIGDETTKLGDSSSIAGDANEDGYKDLLLGNFYYIEGDFSSRGKVNLIYGPIASGNYDVSIVDSAFIGEADGDEAGSALGYSDINGDGYDDILIGAPNYDAGSSILIGKAYLVYSPVDSGEHNLSDTDVSFLGEAENYAAGSSIASAGDVNNDGYNDMLIGSPNDISFIGEESRVYLLYGPVSNGDYDLASSASVMITNESDYDDLGTAVSTAGDVNADGYDDVLMSAPLHETYDPDYTLGRAYLFYGPISNGEYNAGAADATFTNASGSAGPDASSVASGGDTNGDGYSEILIGSNQLNQGYLFYGESGLLGAFILDTDADVILRSELYDDSGVGWTGFAFASGDTNGDGKSDLLITDPIDDAVGESGAGKVYLVCGDALPSSDTYLEYYASDVFHGESYDDLAGLSVSSGDVDDNGLDDILIGAPNHETDGETTGKVYLNYSE